MMSKMTADIYGLLIFVGLSFVAIVSASAIAFPVTLIGQPAPQAYITESHISLVNFVRLVVMICYMSPFLLLANIVVSVAGGLLLGSRLRVSAGGVFSGDNVRLYGLILLTEVSVICGVLLALILIARL